jgi:tetratricopeptide (TPR) repeat protein
LVYATAGRPQHAEAAYRQALDMEPGRIDVTRQLGDLYVRTGRMSEALMLIDALIALEPLDAGAYEARGLIFHALGDSRRAAENYSRSLDLNPRSFRAANNLARLLAEDGDLPTALNWAQAARRLNPDDATAADTLGRIQHTLGSHALAREQLQFAVAAEPGNPAFRFHLAEVYRATGQLDEAAAELTRLLETGAAFSERGAAEDLLGEIDGLR